MTHSMLDSYASCLKNYGNQKQRVQLLFDTLAAGPTIKTLFVVVIKNTANFKIAEAERIMYTQFPSICEIEYGVAV